MPASLLLEGQGTGQLLGAWLAAKGPAAGMPERFPPPHPTPAAPTLLRACAADAVDTQLCGGCGAHLRAAGNRCVAWAGCACAEQTFRCLTAALDNATGSCPGSPFTLACRFTLFCRTVPVQFLEVTGLVTPAVAKDAPRANGRLKRCSVHSAPCSVCSPPAASSTLLAPAHCADSVCC